MRAFVAIDLPEAVRSALARRQAQFRARCGSREHIAWARPEGIHLTLKFLGQITADQASEVTRSLAALSGFGTFRVEVRGCGFFPGPQHPRVFWAGVEAPAALADLAVRVEAACEKVGFAPESRPFAPHLTLARFKDPRPQPSLRAWVEEQANSSLGAFDVTEFFLFESKLKPGGAEYRKVGRFPA